MIKLRHLPYTLAAIPFLFATPQQASAQIIAVTFEATLLGEPVALDSVLIENLTSGGDTTLYAPDAPFVLGAVGVAESARDLGVFQSMPNPFRGSADIVVSSTGGTMLVTVHDATGREVAARRVEASVGDHRFRFTSGLSGIYFVCVQQNGLRRTLRMVSMDGAGNSTLVYNGASDNAARPKDDRSLFQWQAGDELRYTGYITDAGNVVSRMIQQITSTSGPVAFIFGLGIPCTGMSTVTDIDGNTYPVVQIGDQCWMAANLRTTRFSDGTSIGTASNADVNGWQGFPSVALEEVYGRWYTGYAIHNPSGVCPAGWHVPTTAEWTELSDFLGGPTLAGGELKSTATVAGIGGGLGLWQANSNGTSTNSTGFTALAAGEYSGGGVGLAGQFAFIWSSTAIDATHTYFYTLGYNSTNLTQQGEGGNGSNVNGRSVRCIAD